MQLTEHFTLEEMIATEHRRIDNTPSLEIIEKLKFTARGMEHVRLLLGGAPIIVNSGYRCPGLNCVLGGAMTEESLIRLRDSKPSGEVADAVLHRILELLFGLEDSQHMKGEACDFIAPAYGSPFQICRSLVAYDPLMFDQLIYEGTWVHISFVEGRDPRRSVLTWKKRSSYQSGLHE